MHHVGRAGSAGKQWAAKCPVTESRNGRDLESRNQGAGTDGNH